MSDDGPVTDTIQSLTEIWGEHFEYELRGAWRAGYDYVHIYGRDRWTPSDPDKTLVEHGVKALPSKWKEPPPAPDGVRYLHTYVLDDATMRKARDTTLK